MTTATNDDIVVEMIMQLSQALPEFIGDYEVTGFEPDLAVQDVRINGNEFVATAIHFMVGDKPVRIAIQVMDRMPHGYHNVAGHAVPTS